MPWFEYSAIASSGNTVTGKLEGPTEIEVIGLLQRQGLFPLKVRSSEHGGGGVLGKFLPAKKPGKQALAIATHELASLLPAGLPLDRSLDLVVQLTDDSRLKEIFKAVADKVKGGTSFGDALEGFPQIFPKIYVSIVRSGEASGSLEGALIQLGDYLQRAQTTRDQIKSALIYPVILLLAAGLSLGFILTGVLPQFKPFFAEAGASLPVPTQIVMAIGDFLTAWGLVLILTIAGIVVGTRYALKKPAIRLRWDRMMLKIPAVGMLITKFETARFSRTLGTLVKGGLPLPTALSLACDTISNAAMIDVLRGAIVSLREGENLAALLTRSKIFPPLATQLMRVGEETGRMDEMLLHQAELFERDVGRTVERLFGALTPALTIFLGVAVAGIIASVMLAILKVNDLAG